MFFKIGILLCFIAIASANVVKSTLKGVVISVRILFCNLTFLQFFYLFFSMNLLS